MSSHQWSPQRGQKSGALRSPRCTVAAHADYTAVVSLGVKIFCRLAMVVMDVRHRMFPHEPCDRMMLLIFSSTGLLGAVVCPQGPQSALATSHVARGQVRQVPRPSSLPIYVSLGTWGYSETSSRNPDCLDTTFGGLGFSSTTVVVMKLRVVCSANIWRSLGASGAMRTRPRCVQSAAAWPARGARRGDESR